MFRKEAKYEAFQRVINGARERQPSQSRRAATESEPVPVRCSPYPLMVPDMTDIEQANQATLA